MSKGLEAFEDLFSGVKFSSKDIDFDKLYTIVETELKRLETMDKALCNGEVLILKGNQLYSAKVNDAFKDCASVRIKRGG